MLPLGNGIVAVIMPENVARHVGSELARLGVAGPVLVTQVERSWVFLADPNGVVPNPDVLPEGVSVLGCPACLTIPAADTVSTEVSWAVPPDPCRRWLPTLAAVIVAARRTTAEPVGGRRARQPGTADAITTQPMIGPPEPTRPRLV